MAKPNYSFEKRQRELAKKKKKEEKRMRKAAESGNLAQDDDITAVADSEPTATTDVE
ncbi:MAG: hypothetical protein KDI33_11690 [Halioglobus sp.]|nr:hypothetical protein [Halioglobus sp.]